MINAPQQPLIMGIGASFLLHLLLLPLGSYLVNNDTTPVKPDPHLVTEMLQELARGRDKKSNAIERSLVADGAHLKVEPITIEEPLQKTAPIAQAPATQTKLTHNKSSDIHSVQRRHFSPLSRRPENLQRRYTKTFAKSIPPHMPYIDPQHAPENGARVVVLVVLNPINGVIKKISIAQSSDNWAFDQAALMAIKKAAPFPPIDIPWEEFKFRIPLSFHR